MVSIKAVAAVLFAVNWLYLSSSLNDECRINLDGGQGNLLYTYSFIPRPFSLVGRDLGTRLLTTNGTIPYLLKINDHLEWYFAIILYPADLNMIIPVEITCATFLSGTLVTWWTIREEDDDYVELVTLDYNCTSFGQDLVI